MDNKVVEEYYDEYVGFQENIGVNDRIYSLYQRLLKAGLSSSSNLLELGSGIGVMTFLLSKKIKTGAIEAVELSPKSVEFAKKKLTQTYISHINADVVSYSPQMKSIDFVTLFDVIEHIPIARHEELFKNIASYMDFGSQLLINIPSPESIRYDEKYAPEVLQVIDQPIYLQFLVDIFSKYDLEIVQHEKYSLWKESDYAFYLIRKKREFSNQNIQENRSFVEKVKVKLFRIWLKIRYKY